MIDVQKQKDTRNISIQKVGVKDVEILLKLQKKAPTPKFLTVYSKAKMSVGLPAQYKGTHMSRFIEILNEYKQVLIIDNLENILLEMKNKLEATSAYIKLDFKYFVDKTAPVSGFVSPMCYDCAFEGEVKESDKYKFNMIVKVPITTLCPCSKEISKYGAHNQRAMVSVKITYSEEEHIWIEDLVNDIEKCASSELYPLLKREDEKYVTEHAYENPKFVEDVLRDVVLLLRKNDVIDSFEVECESIESIHNHSAWAYQQEIN